MCICLIFLAGWISIWQDVVKCSEFIAYTSWKRNRKKILPLLLTPSHYTPYKGDITWNQMHLLPAVECGTDWNGILSSSKDPVCLKSDWPRKEGNGALTWVHGEALVCLIWLLMSVILSHLCHLGRELQRKHSQAFPRRPNIGQRERVSTAADSKQDSKQKTQSWIWKRPTISVVSLRASSISGSLWCFQVT